MSKYSQGFFVPTHPEKYMGNGRIKYRSSWEWTFMRFLDTSPGVIQWASESIKIPYRNPFTGKNTIYVPDFLVVYENKTGTKNVELVEIKPSKETTLENVKSIRDRAAVALNMYKWEAARAFCNSQGIKFRVITELDMFKNGKA